MRRQTLVTALVVAMVAIAGCGGSVSPGDGGSGEGTVNMYISDQPSAIDDFEHLNVTVTSVAAHRVDDDGTETNESQWVEQEIDNVTVDLTQLQGSNASQLGEIPAPNGTYDKTFIHVSEVNGTLTNGESTDVMLPSSKLHINENFTVGNGEEIDFVFDITVVKRGNSGSYNIQPVASESGTGEQVEIEDKDDDSEDAANETEDTESLTLSLDGNATAGENVTVSVAGNGSAVSGAEISLDGDTVGETGENGTLVVSVPADAEEIELEATSGEAEEEATFDVAANASTEAPALAAPTFAAV